MNDLLILLIVVILGSCKFSNNKPLEVKNEVTFTNFQPDTTINTTLVLNSESSILKIFGDLMSKLRIEEDYPDVYFKSKDEYLRLLFFPGNGNNMFSRFEVGYIKDLNSYEGQIMESGFEKIETESGISLGIKFKDLVRIKGNNFLRVNKGEYFVVSFNITDPANDILMKNNLPMYLAEYKFNAHSNELVNFSFGVEYP